MFGGNSHKMVAGTKALGLLLLASASATMTLAPSAQAQLSGQCSFNIAAQPLTEAIMQFGRQSGLQVTADTRLVAGKTGAAVSGNHAPAEALSMLLAGTGLTFRFTSRTTAILEPAPHASVDAVQLGPVRVEGAQGASLVASSDPGATEGTGSYAPTKVTVGKSAQSLREIPQSVSVITRKRMDDQNMTTVSEALDQVTGVRSFGYERQEQYIIRGYAANAQYNGVPQQEGSDKASSNTDDLAFFDRIEVLRGPSGLLTGSGEPGGTINYVRKRPTDALAIAGLASLGSWDRYRGEIDVGGPVTASGNLRARIVGVYQDEDKYYDVGFNKDRGIYGVVEYDLTPRTTIGVSGIYSQRKFINSFGLPLYDDNSVPARGSFTGSDATSRQRSRELFVDLSHDFGSDWSFKAAYSLRRMDYGGYSVFPGDAIDRETGLVPSLSAGRVEQETKWHSFDAHVTGPLHLFGRTHDLTFGVNRSRYDFIGGTKFVNPGAWDVLNDHDLSAIIDDNITYRYETVTAQTGFYGSARIRLADPLTIVLGGRLTNFKIKDRDVVPEVTPWIDSSAKSSGRFTPYAGVVLDVTDQLTLYASYTDTFVPQTAQNVNNRTLAPRVGWQMETGVKGSFFNDALNASVALFRIHDSNRAIVDEVNVGCGGTIDGTCSRAAGKVRSQGVEVDIGGSPLPGWDITLGYTYNQQKYLSDTDPTNVGQRFLPAQSPEQMFKLWTQFDLGKAGVQGWASGLNLGAGVQAQSNMYTDLVRQNAYAIANAKAGYRVSENWDLSLVVNNLFDRTYLRIPGYAIFYNIYGEPRNFRLTLRGKI
ncbi:TonB-dependent siderophore receptor [Sphingobium yanoikuyae]|uniref:TonB-dependent siderophore receptor n=1 Tax=Sphingobium yanoikuyae TaxID=13690 RepID=UPI00241F3126|nr:TonB-dependent siderophore receptor [Sphingobium yanoikuyae]